MLLAETCSLILVPSFNNSFPILSPTPFLNFLLTLRSRNSEPKKEVVTCSCLWDPRSYNPEFAGVCLMLEQFFHHSSTKGIVLSPLPRSQGDYHLNPEHKEKKQQTISLRFQRSCDTNKNILQTIATESNLTLYKAGLDELGIGCLNQGLLEESSLESREPLLSLIFLCMTCATRTPSMSWSSQWGLHTTLLFWESVEKIMKNMLKLWSTTPNQH